MAFRFLGFPGAGRRNNYPSSRARQTAALVLASLSMFAGFQTAQAQMKFAALGNFSFDPSGQKIVADTLKQTAASEHISFIVSPGSNFSGGVTGADDPQWQEKFEQVYGDDSKTLSMPFFTVLGAEDWAGDFGAMRDRTDLVYGSEGADGQLSTAPKWTLPNWWYHYLMHFPASTGSSFIGSGHKDLGVGIIFVDTWILSSSFPFSNVTNQAWKDLEKTLNIAPKILDYIMVVGDRPIFSSGSSKGDSGLQYYLQPMLKKAGVDLYISGYDFDMEVIEDDGLTHVNCGSGSAGASNAFVMANNSKYFSGKRGFCIFELNADGFNTKFVDGENGQTLFTHTQPIKSRPERSTTDQLSYIGELPEVKYVPVQPMGKLPGRDAFIRVVGTIGLCMMSILALFGVATAMSKIVK